MARCNDSAAWCGCRGGELYSFWVIIYCFRTMFLAIEVSYEASSMLHHDLTNGRKNIGFFPLLAIRVCARTIAPITLESNCARRDVVVCRCPGISRLVYHGSSTRARAKQCRPVRSSRIVREVMLLHGLRMSWP